MGWVKLDDRFPENPKIEALTDRAFRLYVRGLCYSAAHLTDGFIPRAVARRLGSLKSAGELMARGLWLEQEGGYGVNDYLEYNPSREQMDAKRNANRNASRIRWRNPKPIQDGMQNVLGDGYGTGLGDLSSSFARFWKTAPRREGYASAADEFAAAVAEGADPEDIIAGAERWLENVARQRTEERFVQKPANWLAARGWLDEYAPAPPRPVAHTTRSAEELLAELDAEEASRG